MKLSELSDVQSSKNQTMGATLFGLPLLACLILSVDRKKNIAALPPLTS